MEASGKAGDECGWEPVVGSLAPYIIHLAPTETHSIQLPLDAFGESITMANRLGTATSFAQHDIPTRFYRQGESF